MSGEIHIDSGRLQPVAGIYDQGIYDASPGVDPRIVVDASGTPRGARRGQRERRLPARERFALGLLAVAISCPFSTGCMQALQTGEPSEAPRDPAALVVPTTGSFPGALPEQSQDFPESPPVNTSGPDTLPPDETAAVGGFTEWQLLPATRIDTGTCIVIIQNLEYTTFFPPDGSPGQPVIQFSVSDGKKGQFYRQHIEDPRSMVFEGTIPGCIIEFAPMRTERGGIRLFIRYWQGPPPKGSGTNEEANFTDTRQSASTPEQQPAGPPSATQPASTRLHPVNVLETLRRWFGGRD